MAIPSRFRDLPLEPLVRHGIVVAMYPSSDPAFDLELHRSRGSSASSNFQEIAQLNGIGLRTYQFTDILPNDNITTWYKARSVLQGYTDSPFTSAVAAKPAALLNSPLRDKYPQLQLSGRALNTDINISPSATLRVGDAVAASTTLTAANSIQKKLRLHSGLAACTLSSVRTQHFNDGVAPRESGVTTQWVVPIDLPVGTAITGAAARFTRPTAAQLCRVRLQRVINNTVLTLWDKTSTQTGAHTLTTTTVSQLVASTMNFSFLVDLRSTAATPADTIYGWGELTYRMASYDATR